MLLRSPYRAFESPKRPKKAYVCRAFGTPNNLAPLAPFPRFHRMMPSARIPLHRRTRRSRSARRGLTLVEIVIGVLIMGIVAAAGGIRYTTALQTTAVGQACRRLAADIETARHAARSRRQSVTLSFNTSAHTYQLVGLVDPDRPSLTSTTVRLADYSPSLVLSSAAFGGDASLSFNEFGVPDSGGTARIAWGTTSQTVTVAAGTGSVSVP